MTRQAVILAGGKGTRLRQRLDGRPKPLVDVDGTPLLGRQLQLLARNGFDSALILVNHAADQIEAFCRETDFGLALTTLDDGEAKGTAGAVLAALDRLAPRFLVLYGDTLLDVDLARMWETHAHGGAAATLFLHPNDHPHDSDLVETDASGDITGFHSYPHPPDALLPNLVNAALYVIERDALTRWRDASPPLDFAKDLFPRMVAAGERLRGYVSFEYIKDIGTPARLDKAIRHLRTGVVERARSSRPQKGVLFDRDGTLNQLAGHIRDHEDLHLLPGIAQAVRRLNDAEYRVGLVTNQPVVARGEATLQDLRLIHNKLETELGRSGGWLDLILLCPHHPDAGFSGEVASLKIRCACRKPGIALIEEARDRLNLDMPQSWFVGDSTTDMLAARRSGLRSILVRTGEGGRDGRARVTPDVVVDDVPAAVRFILETYPALRDRLAPLTARIRPGDVVLIGGRAHLGKSTVARALAWTLAERGGKPLDLALDRFIKSAADRDGNGLLGRYELEAARAMLSPWLERGTATELTLPWYDRHTRTRHPAVDHATLERETVLILEGVPALLFALPESPATRRAVHRVWVGGNEEERHRRILRTLTGRGSSPAEAEAIYASRLRDEDALIESGRRSDDLQLTMDDLLPAPAG